MVGERVADFTKLIPKVWFMAPLESPGWKEYEDA